MRNQNGEPVSCPKCQAIAARRYDSGSTTGTVRGTSNSEKSISAIPPSWRSNRADLNELLVRRFDGLWCGPIIALAVFLGLFLATAVLLIMRISGVFD